MKKEHFRVWNTIFSGRCLKSVSHSNINSNIKNVSKCANCRSEVDNYIGTRVLGVIEMFDNLKLDIQSVICYVTGY